MLGERVFFISIETLFTFFNLIKFFRYLDHKFEENEYIDDCGTDYINKDEAWRYPLLHNPKALVLSFDTQNDAQRMKQQPSPSEDNVTQVA